MGTRWTSFVIIQIVFVCCNLDVTSTELITSLIWSKGCRKLDSEVVLSKCNVSGPAECLYNCRRLTNSFAVQGSQCHCLKETSEQPSEEIRCDTCKDDVTLKCGNIQEGYWSVYVKEEDTPHIEAQRDNFDSINKCIAAKKNLGNMEMVARHCEDELPVLCYSVVDGECYPLTEYTRRWVDSSSACFLYMSVVSSSGRLESCVSSFSHLASKSIFWIGIRSITLDTTKWTTYPSYQTVMSTTEDQHLTESTVQTHSELSAPNTSTQILSHKILSNLTDSIPTTIDEMESTISTSTHPMSNDFSETTERDGELQPTLVTQVDSTTRVISQYTSTDHYSPTSSNFNFMKTSELLEEETTYPTTSHDFNKIFIEGTTPQVPMNSVSMDVKSILSSSTESWIKTKIERNQITKDKQKSEITTQNRDTTYNDENANTGISTPNPVNEFTSESISNLFYTSSVELTNSTKDTTRTKSGTNPNRSTRILLETTKQIKTDPELTPTNKHSKLSLSTLTGKPKQTSTRTGYTTSAKTNIVTVQPHSTMKTKTISVIEGNNLAVTSQLAASTTTDDKILEAPSQLMNELLSQHLTVNEIETYCVVFGACMLVLLLVLAIFLALINRSIRKLTKRRFSTGHRRGSSSARYRKRSRPTTFLSDEHVYGSSRRFTRQNDVRQQNGFNNYGYQWSEDSRDDNLSDDIDINVFSRRNGSNVYQHRHAPTLNRYREPSPLHSGYTSTGRLASEWF